MINRELQQLRQGCFPVDEIFFSSLIPAGNGQRFTRLAAGSYKFQIRVPGESFAQYFNIAITAGRDSGPVRLQVSDGIAWGKTCLAYSWYQPVISLDDGRTWQSVPDLQARLISRGSEIKDQAIEYSFRLPASSLRFASVIPYPVERLQQWINDVSSKYADYVVAGSCGRTAAGRDIPVLRITDPAVAGHQKLKVTVAAGQHPAETEPRYVVEGLVEGLLQERQELGRFEFEIIPLINLDGVIQGRSYTNLHDGNLSTAWESVQEPELSSLCKYLRGVKPDLFIDLHSGDYPHVSRLYYAMNEQEKSMLEHDFRHEVKTVPLGAIQPCNGRAPDVLLAKGMIGRGVLLEVARLPNEIQWYHRQGREISRFLVRFGNNLRSPGGEKAVLHSGYRFVLTDFLEQLPECYFPSDLDHLQEIAGSTYNFEVIGLDDLLAGQYDVYLQDMVTPKRLQVSLDGREWFEYDPEETGSPLFAATMITNRKIGFYIRGDLKRQGHVLAVPAGIDPADCRLESFQRYRRRTRLESRPVYRDWPRVYRKIMATDFSIAALKNMFSDLVQWIKNRQVDAAGDPHYGAVYSQEDKYSFRDAACAAVSFMRQYHNTGDKTWLERARAAVDFCYKGQQFTAGPDTMGGLGEMGMLGGGRDYRRITDPPSVVSGVDTGIIACQLAEAFELGLGFRDEDADALRQMAVWFANNEYRPGLFLHHQGSVADCQNSNAIGAAALTRISRLFHARNLLVPSRWSAAAERGVRHVLEGQEAIGVWPYLFAGIGRGQQYHWQSVPDQGMLLYHLLQCEVEPGLKKLIDESGCLGRIACWYLLTSRLDDDGLTIDYEDNPGDNLGFSSFTWCRFMACASLARIWGRIGNERFWKRFVLAQLQYIHDHLWQENAADTAPVRASIVPLKLHSWIQAAEWDAVLLHEVIDRIG